VGGWCPKKEDW
jgi:hypothetical protein